MSVYECRYVFMYECVRGTRRSIALSMVLAALIVLGLMCEVAGSQWGWFADFTDRALQWDLMPSYRYTGTTCTTE